MKTDMIGSAMNRIIAAIEGRINQMNVRCFMGLFRSALRLAGRAGPSRH
jgi:hypothetical protein